MNKLETIQQKLKAPKDLYNSFGKYTYRSAEGILNALKPILKEVDAYIVITDDLQYIGDRYYVKASVSLFDSVTGNLIASTSAFAREEENKKGMDGSQITGASSSYARKYALNGMFLIDDVKDSDATNNGENNQAERTSKPDNKTLNKDDKYISSEQKNQLKDKLGGAGFAKVMNEHSGKLTVKEFEKIIGE